MFKLPSRRICGFFAALFLMLNIITGSFAPKKAYAAYTQSLIQCTINTGTWEVLAGAVTGVSGSVAVFTYEEAIEYRRIGGTLSLMVDTEYPADAAGYLGSEPNSSGGNAKKDLILTFPGNVSEGLSRTSATDIDISRAQLVRNQLVFSLNDAFVWVMGNNGVYQPDGNSMDEKIASYQTDMQTFLSKISGANGSNGSFSFYFYSSSPSEFADLSERDFPDQVTWFTDYVCIKNNATGESRYFLFRMPKGYRDVPADGRPNTSVPATLGLAKTDRDDAVFVHWGHLAAEAFINYRITDDNLRISPDEVYNSDTSALSEMFTDFAISAVDSISNILGLWSLDELIFNSGTRGSSVYADGVFPSSWQPIIWAFFFISEIAAFIMIIYAILWNVGRRLRSTVNPIMRASAMDQLKTLIICAVILGLLPITYKILMNVSYHLSGAFAGLLNGVTAKDKFGLLGSSAGGIGGVLIAALYLGIMVYFNMLYLVRGVTVAFLMIVGPIAVASMAINVEKRQLTVTWAEEFFAQLFIQPIQALFLSFLLLLPTGAGRKIEALVLVYSLIPLTKMAKKVIFPKGGDGLVDIADKGKQAAGKFGSTVAGIGAGAALGATGVLAGGAGKSGVAEGNNGASDNSNASGAASSSNSGNSSSNSGVTDYGTSQNGGWASDTGVGMPAAASSSGSAPASYSQSPSEPEVTSGTNSSSTSGSTEAGQAQKLSLRERISGAVETAKAALANPKDALAAASEKIAEGAITAGSKALDNVKAAGTAVSSASGKAKEWLSDKNNQKRLAMGAGAVTLGALGGAQDVFNRRVFGLRSGSQGGTVTQFSKKLGSQAVTKPTSTPTAQETPESISGANREPASSPAAQSGFDPQGIERWQYENIMSREDMKNAYTMDNSPVERTENGNGTYNYDVDRDGARDIGISGVKHGSKENGTAGQTTVSYNPQKLSDADNAKLSHMYSTFKNGTDEEKARLKELGVENMTVTEKNNGQVSKVNVSYNNEAARTNFGLNVAGKDGVTSTTKSKTTPEFVPNIAKHGIEVPERTANPKEPAVSFSVNNGSVSIEMRNVHIGSGASVLGHTAPNEGSAPPDPAI